MEELLAGVADAVVAAGGATIEHVGTLDEVIDGETVGVIVPHEYFALDPAPEPSLLRRTIGFGVEHPGTATFEASAAIMGELGGAVEIAPDSLAEMHRRGVPSRHFVLGYRPVWDEIDPGLERDIDVLHLGTADEPRLRQLAPVAAQLATCRTELYLAPHEPMTSPRPYFVTGAEKRALLRRSRLLLNVHREGASAFEWVRALDAIANGCVVLTTPSSGIDPLVPGEHVLVADPSRIGLVALAALEDPNRLAAMAHAARGVCRDRLDMVESASQLLELATEVHVAAPWDFAAAPAVHVRSAERRPGPTPLAEWVPAARRLPDAASTTDARARRVLRQLDDARRRLAPVPSVTRAEVTDTPPRVVDVVCVMRPGDGPARLTLDSLRDPAYPVAVHLALAAGGSHRQPAPETLGRLTSLVVHPVPVGRGAARNHLLSLGNAPFVFVVDAGDELLGSTLRELVGLLVADDRLEIAYPMATLGTQLVVNAFVPDSRRLARDSYLDRGYLVRRTLLERLGGFAEDPALEGYVDHDFWRRATAAHAGAELRRSVGVRLWEQHPDLALADVDPAGTLAALAGGSAASPP
jgi:hypothetical protein